MNREIVILREVIKKLVPMLAGRGLVVTQIGTQAYVAPNPITGLPARVNIPCIPDNAETEFVEAIQGFIDHEVGHVLKTDFLVGREERKQDEILHNLFNILEDTMIERQMGEDFPGSKKNIARLRRHFLAKISGPAIAQAKTKEEAFGYLLVVMMRALAGHVEMQEFMDKHDHWKHPMVAELMLKMPDEVKQRLTKIAKTQESFDIAKILKAIMFPPPPPPPPMPPMPSECDSKNDTKNESEEQSDDESQSSDGSSDKSEPKEGDADDSDEKDQDDKSDGDDEGEGSDADKEDGEEGDEDAEGSSGDDDEDHSDEEQSGDDGEGDGEREHKDDAESDKAGGGDQDNETDEDSENGEGENEGSGGEEDSADDVGADDGNKEESEGDASDDAGDDDDSEEQDDDGQSSDGASGEDEGDQDEAEDGENDANGSEQDGSASGSDGDEPEDADADETGEEDEGNQADDGAGGDGDGEDQDAGADGAPDEQNGEEDSGDKADASAQDVNIAVEIESDHSDQGEAPEEADQKGGVEGVGYTGPSAFEKLTPEDLADKDLSRAVAILIQKQMIEVIDEADYSVFTREYDVMEPLRLPDPNACKYEQKEAMQKLADALPAKVAALDEQTGQMTGAMQKEIERMMAAQSRTFNYGGKRSGRLNGPGLHRIVAGDARIFAQREEIRAKDTAVTLLVDCSGSMSMGGKIQTAMSAAYALSQTLTRVNIPFECLGFTTWHIDENGPWPKKRYKEWSKAINDEPHIRSFSRLEPIYMPIFKDFDKRFDADAKRRYAHMPGSGVMGANIDGESLEYAAIRLLKRREKRKVMIVLSDGHPAGARNDAEHLAMMTRKLTKMGIDLVGIGIKDHAVKRFYEKALVLSEVSELPAAVMGELRQILMK